jgi:hypothetical protein
LFLPTPHHPIATHPKTRFRPCNHFTASLRRVRLLHIPFDAQAHFSADATLTEKVLVLLIFLPCPLATRTLHLVQQPLLSSLLLESTSKLCSALSLHVVRSFHTFAQVAPLNTHIIVAMPAFRSLCTYSIFAVCLAQVCHSPSDVHCSKTDIGRSGQDPSMVAAAMEGLAAEADQAATKKIKRMPAAC